MLGKPSKNSQYCSRLSNAILLSCISIQALHCHTSLWNNISWLQLITFFHCSLQRTMFLTTIFPPTLITVQFNVLKVFLNPNYLLHIICDIIICSFYSKQLLFSNGLTSLGYFHAFSTLRVPSILFMLNLCIAITFQLISFVSSVNAILSLSDLTYTFVFFMRLLVFSISLLPLFVGACPPPSSAASITILDTCHLLPLYLHQPHQVDSRICSEFFLN